MLDHSFIRSSLIYVVLFFSAIARSTTDSIMSLKSFWVLLVESVVDLDQASLSR